MKASKSRLGHPPIMESLDGPPLDFSFKNMRSLQQIHENMPKNFGQINQQQDMNITLNKQSSLKNSNEANEQQRQTNEQKIQIIRTIQRNSHQTLDHFQNINLNKIQKGSKVQKKIVQPQTTSLFLRYNKITSIKGFIEFIEPLFLDLNRLMWIDISHNRLIELCQDLGKLNNLKTLYIHANYISNFKQFQKIKKASNLKMLTVHGNPIQEYGEFRIIIHSILPSLKKIDSTLVTKRQTDRSNVLMKSMKKYPNISKARKPPQKSDSQDEG